MKNHEQFKQELSKAAEDTTIFVQEFYMAERSWVILNLKMVVANSGKYMPLRAIEYVREKLVQKDLVKNLISWLVRNSEWSQEFKGLLSDAQK